MPVANVDGSDREEEILIDRSLLFRKFSPIKT